MEGPPPKPLPEDEDIEIVDLDSAGASRLETLAKLARGARKILPGDSAFGDPLSTGGDGASQALGRRIAEISADRPSVLRELGLERCRSTRRWPRAAGTSGARRSSPSSSPTSSASPTGP